MTSIKMFGIDFNKIMHIMRKFVAKSDSRKALNYIKLEHTAGSEKITAVGLDGFMLAKIVVPAIHDGDIEDTSFEALISIMPNTKANFIIISQEEDKTVIEHVGLYTIAYPRIREPYINWPQILPNRESSYEISVNPHMLARALSGYPRDARCVTLKFGDPIHPILLERNGEDDQILVLPIRVAH